MAGPVAGSSVCASDSGTRGAGFDPRRKLHCFLMSCPASLLIKSQVSLIKSHCEAHLRYLFGGEKLTRLGRNRLKSLKHNHISQTICPRSVRYIVIIKLMLTLNKKHWPIFASRSCMLAHWCLSNHWMVTVVNGQADSHRCRLCWIPICQWRTSSATKIRPNKGRQRRLWQIGRTMPWCQSHVDDLSSNPTMKIIFQ